MGLRAPCPRPRGTPPWESHARPPSRTGSQRSGAAGLSRAKAIKTRVSYAGECSLEEAVSQYLAARANSRAIPALAEAGA